MNDVIKDCIFLEGFGIIILPIPNPNEADAPIMMAVLLLLYFCLNKRFDGGMI